MASSIRGDVVLAYFQATNTGAAQTGIVDSTYTKVVFGTEEFDVGGYYDPSLSRWTPPAGPVRISSHFRATGTWVAGTAMDIAIYKNGVIWKDHGGGAGVANRSEPSITVIDVANGTDYYEVFCWLDTSSGTATIPAGTTEQNFCGHQI